ncbi:MAG: LytTR family DNA-binding domain-containing protein [Mariniphaga sp.]
MKILIVEDEEFAAKRLIQMVSEMIPDADLYGPLDSVTATVDHLSSVSDYDLIFLDIQLADGKSFSIFERCQISVPVIFTTAYDEYALQAFELNSIDYLLKPIKREKLSLSIEKFKKLKEYYKSGNPNDKLYEILKGLIPEQKVYKDRFLINKGDLMIPIKASEISCFYAEDKEVILVTHDNRRYFVAYSIEDLSGKLDHKLFFRANRQYIISIDAIKKVHTYFNFKLKVEIKTDPKAEIIISRARTTAFKSWLNGDV